MTMSTLSTSDQVQELYVAYFGRPADPTGLAYWTGVLEAGHPLSVIGAAFSASAEYMAQVPSLGADLIVNATNANQIVNSFYVNLFGHNADAGGLEYWANILLNQKATISQVAADIAGGAQGTDATTLAAKISSADTFTTDVSLSTNAILAYSGAGANSQAKVWLSGVNDQLANGTADATGAVLAANVTAQAGIEANTIANLSGAGQTYTLTTGVDTIANPSGNDNVINGTNATITPLDSINLGSTTGNVLNVVDTHITGATTSTNADLALLSVSGVQTLNLLSASALSGAAADVSGWTGLTNANFTLKDVETLQTITAAATTAVNLTETINVASGTQVTGGSVDTVTAINAAANVAETITVDGAKGTTSVTVDQTATGTGSNAIVSIVDKGYATNAAGTITSVALSGYSAGATINDNGLTTLTLAGSGDGVTVGNNAVTPTNTTLALNLNAVSDTAGLTDAIIKTLNITTGGTTGSSFTLAATAALKTLTVAGTEALSLGALPATLTSVAVSGGAGLTATLGADTTAFASTSTGTDVITIDTATTVAVTGNGTTGEEIVWGGKAAPAGTLDGDLATSTGSVTGFTTLGISGNLTVDSTFSMKAFPGITGLDVQGGATATISFTNVVAGTTLAIDSSETAAVSYAEAGSTGATDTVSLSVGSKAAASITVASLTLEDSATSAHGIGTVNVTSNSHTTAAANVITALVDANLTTLTVGGSAGLTITDPIDTKATTFTVTANDTDANGVTLTSVTAAATSAGLTTLVFGGVADISIPLFTDTTATTLTITDSNAGAVTIGDVVAVAATTLNVTNSSTAGTLTITTDATTASLATIDLNGSVALTLTGDSVTTGVTVAGSTDNAAVSLTLAGSAATYTDSITLGNGKADMVDVTAAAGTETISLGNGAGDTVTVVDAVGTSTSTITVGNGGTATHVNVVDVSADIGAATITVGTGVDTVKLGPGQEVASGTSAAGVQTVTFGAHTSTTISYDTLDLSLDLGNNSFANAGNNPSSIITSGLDIVTGLVKGDQIVLPQTDTVVANAASLAGAIGDVEFAHGTYSASAGTFAYNASGADTLMTYDSDGTHLVSVVLVGTTFTSHIAAVGAVVTIA